jgi:quinol monooxygenase YgiN
MATPHVQDMIAWMSTVPLLEGTPTVYSLEFIPGFSFSRPQVAIQENPHVIFAALDYKPNTVPTSLPYWQAVVDTSKNDEPGTLLYGICRDAADENKLFTVEAYESKEYLTDVHVKSQAIAESIKNTKHLRNGLKHTFLKLQAGYLYKESNEDAQAQL